MALEPLIPILIPATFVLYLVIERRFPGRPQPRVKGWLAKGILFFVLAGVMNAALPGLIVGAIGGAHIVDLSALGLIAGAVVSLLAGDLVGYWIHRCMHHFAPVWRWTHQMHHSAERVDIAGASYAHPIDNFVQGTVNIAAVVALGLSPGAAAVAGYLSFFVGMFQHMNIRTPQWLGYVIQRPEAHAVHHTRGVHAYNYGNFMLWDLLFGTFRNPATFPAGPSGFWDGASRKMGAMLIGRDVGEPGPVPAGVVRAPSPGHRAATFGGPPLAAEVTCFDIL